MPRKRNGSPTLKERLFVRKAIETKSLKKAAQAVYGNKVHGKESGAAAMVHAERTAKRPIVQALFDKYIDDEKVMMTLRDQLEAKEYNSNLEDWVPDNSSRLKAVDLSLKVRGAYPSDQKYTIGNQQVNFIITKSEASMPGEEVEVDAKE